MDANKKSKVVVIGGGLTGLAAAHRFTELKREGRFDVDFLLLEAGSTVGGVIKTVRRDGFLLEAGADSFLAEKQVVQELAARLGIADQLIETNREHRRSFLVRKDKLHPIPEGFRLIAPTNLKTFFASEIISWRGKVRLANEQFLLAQTTDDDESLADFVRRRFGGEALERIAQPMFAGIYTADPEKLSIKATQPRFVELEQRYGSVIRGLQEISEQRSERLADQDSPTGGTSGARYGLFLSFKNGMQTLLDALVQSLPTQSIRLNTEALALTFSEGQSQWKITTNNGEIHADAVCLALPAHALARLLKPQFPELSSEFAGIEHASTATINLAFRRDRIAHALDGFGFVVPFVEKKTLMACTFSSVKFPDRAPNDHVLLRAFVGGALQPDKFALDDDKMVSGILADLRELVGLSGAPLFYQIERWRDSMPQYHIGHLERLERISNLKFQIPNLEIVTNAADGVGIPDCLRRAIDAGDKLANKLSATAN